MEILYVKILSFVCDVQSLFYPLNGKVYWFIFHLYVHT
jgi:hypothetical protein